MGFNFRVEPITDRSIAEKEQKAQLLAQDRERIINANKQKATANSMQSTVLGQLSSVQPSNPNASVAPSPSVEAKQGW